MAAYVFSPGERVSVHYDPAIPDRSILKVDADTRPWGRLGLGTVLLTAGLAALLWTAGAA